MVFPALSCSAGRALPSDKLHQQVLKSCVHEEVMEGRVTVASSPVCASAVTAVPLLESNDSDKSFHCF